MKRSNRSTTQFVCRPQERILRQPGGKSHLGTFPAATIVERFAEAVERFSDQPALRVRRGGEWRTWSFKDYYRDVRRVAKALIALGMQSHEVVCIIGFNAPEWMMANLGAITMGGIAAGIYTTNSPAACQYISNHSAARVVVCENIAQLVKFLTPTPNAPSTKNEVLAYVVYGEDLSACATSPHATLLRRTPNIYSWIGFLQLGVGVDEATLDARIRTIMPGQCANLIYTSGTTGPPKAAMISHDNITWTTRAVINLFSADCSDCMVSYLPLSHIAANMLDIHGPITAGLCMHFAQPDALRGSLRDTLVEVQPTLFFGVPRVYEKIQERMLAVSRKRNALFRAMAKWAKQQGTKISDAEEFGGKKPWSACCVEMLIFRQIRKALGLTRCRQMFSAAAPLAPETASYFRSVRMPIYEVYGLSESSGPQTYNIPGTCKRGTAGVSMPGTEMVIMKPADNDALPAKCSVMSKGEGEVCFRGRNVFMGYLHDPAKSAAAIDPEGFLHSGDLGTIDADGFLSITGRQKELLVTSGGENVAPRPIEWAVKEEMSAVSNAMLVGDEKKFLSCLVALKTELDPETQRPLEELTGDALRVSEEIGSTATTVAGATRCSRWSQYLEEGFERVNSRSTSRAQKVRKWVLLPADFSVDTGELTATRKLKRKVVLRKYAALVDTLYQEATTFNESDKPPRTAGTVTHKRNLGQISV